MTDAPIAALLRELVSEIRGLRGDLAQRQRRRLTPADEAALRALLPVVAAAVGDRAFTLAELREHALLPMQTELRSALEAAGGPNRVGRLLRRADGFAVEGLRAECVGDDRDGLVWCVRGVVHRVDRADA
jgi:hypothetical protein